MFNLNKNKQKIIKLFKRVLDQENSLYLKLWIKILFLNNVKINKCNKIIYKTMILFRITPYRMILLMKIQIIILNQSLKNYNSLIQMKYNNR